MNGAPNYYSNNSMSVGEWYAPSNPSQYTMASQQQQMVMGMVPNEPIGVFQVPISNNSSSQVNEISHFQNQSNGYHYGQQAYTNGFSSEDQGSHSDQPFQTLGHQGFPNPQIAAALARAALMNESNSNSSAQNGTSESPQPMSHMGEMNGSHNGSIGKNPSPDHNRMYTQPPPMMTTVSSGINFDNYESIPIDVKGENVPTPIATFREANLNPYIQECVDMCGYVKPTPVQKHAIPTLMTGRDLMACAQTGSGKTAAFLLPIINHILNEGAQPSPKVINPQTRRHKQFPSALILSPTRELAMQIHKEATKFSYKTPVVTVMFYGGRENYREQLNKIRNGCHIVIATPGRLIDVVQQGYMSLEQCRFLVLDEADRMLDMGFEPQIRKIVGNGMPCKMTRLTAMFSATFPREIKALAEDFLNPNFVHLAVGRVGSTSENIEQNVLWVEEADKRRQLQMLLDSEESNALILCFVETKRGANELASQLQRLGLRAVAIHGDLKQPERERNLELFRSGANPVLVATAVASRGLDIPNVKHVVNYDMPNDVDEYVHRIGRTGRCGNVGCATSFFNEKNRGLGRDLLACLTETNKIIPDWLPTLASQPHQNSRNKFNNRGRGSASRGSFLPNQSGSAQVFGVTGGTRGNGLFGNGVQRGSFQNRMQNSGAFGGNQSICPNPYNYGGNQNSFVPMNGAFAPNGFPAQTGFGQAPTPGQFPPPLNNFQRGPPNPGTYRAESGFSNATRSTSYGTSRGAFGGTLRGAYRTGFNVPQPGIRMPPAVNQFGNWQPRTAPVPN